MTVHELMGAYFDLDSPVQAVRIVRNDEGEQKILHSNPHGCEECYIKPETRNAVIRRWGIARCPWHIWISVE